MSAPPESKAIISGLGISAIGRRLGIPALDLTVEAAREAIADAGLTPADVDGIATMGDTPPDEAQAALGIEATLCTGFATGGLLSPVMSAFLAVAEDQARHVLVYRTVQMMGGTILPAAGGNGSGGGGAGAPPSPGDAARLASVMGDMGSLLAHHAYSAANWVAMHCARHMHLYGTTREQLGAIAVNARRNAARNPRAVYRAPMTLDDYLAARPISTPLGLYDCDVPVDGAIAVVVSAADHATDCPNPPVRVAAMGGAPGTGGWIHRPDYPAMASVEAAAELWSRTDLTPADVDVAELYDGFTFLTIAWLEALGLCGPGEGGPFVEGGERIALDGELPLNTYGGQLSAGRLHGYWVLHEACLQLRGAAGERQVPGSPEVAVVSAGGGPIAGCILLTR
ncbi:MAG TPA: thiolase family protein [Acidimicrobiales bacterium]